MLLFGLAPRVFHAFLVMLPMSQLLILLLLDHWLNLLMLLESMLLLEVLKQIVLYMSQGVLGWVARHRQQLRQSKGHWLLAGWSRSFLVLLTLLSWL